MRFHGRKRWEMLVYIKRNPTFKKVVDYNMPDGRVAVKQPVKSY
jgi:hypothetical protein